MQLTTLTFFQGLKVTMKKHPSCYKLNEPLKAKNAQVHSEPVVLYDGMYNMWKKLYPLSRSGLGYPVFT